MCSLFCNTLGKAQTPGWVARGRRPRQRKQGALRWVWGELVTSEERRRGQVWRSAPRLANRECSVDCPSGISLQVRCFLRACCYEQMFHDAWMKDGGSHTGHELCVHFRLEFALICFSGFDLPGLGWMLRWWGEWWHIAPRCVVTLACAPTSLCVAKSSHTLLPWLAVHTIAPWYLFCTYKNLLPQALKGSI